MMVSKSMEFPSGAKPSYAAQVQQSHPNQFQENTLSFLPVPGPVGPQGQPGKDGKDGKDGEQGPEGLQGKEGPRGERGHPGKNGESSLSSSGQQAGWASYINTNPHQIKLGADKGLDGWVSIFMNSSKKDESYIPKNTVSLWNQHSRMLNFKGLKTGSQVFITYNFELQTFNPNTEVWIRTYFPEIQEETSQLVGSFKYQHIYQLSITQQLFIENKEIWGNGAVPQIRTDFDSVATLNSIYVSVV